MAQRHHVHQHQHQPQRRGLVVPWFLQSLAIITILLGLFTITNSPAAECKSRRPQQEWINWPGQPVMKQSAVERVGQEQGTQLRMRFLLDFFAILCALDGERWIFWIFFGWWLRRARQERKKCSSPNPTTGLSPIPRLAASAHDFGHFCCDRVLT